jgi:hypothetical protein
MFKMTYTKRCKRDRRLIASGVRAFSIGQGQAGDGPGLRLEWVDENGQRFNATIDDDHTLAGLAEAIAGVMRDRAARRAKERAALTGTG